MRRSLIANCLTLFLAISSSFSQPLPKTLLWRISGNGLTKPSYVYGTMHVNDPRLFILGDSLLNAISGSEGFANELDMNQITPMVTDMVKQDLIHAASVKDVLSKKAFDEYGPALAKKFKKPAEEITTTDILKEKNGWIHERIRGKSMQTFLDAYLTDLADRQGKWIGGIEDFSDQSGLVSSLVDESDIRQLVLSDGTGQKAEMENMTTIYLNGDLEGFQRIINGMDSSYKDKLLIRRNHKMAYRMDSLAHVRSLVFAVGAAHLPGDEGLIRLLKARGFNVEPVFSSKKIKPQDYSVHAVVRPWVEVNDPDGRYKVMMPGTPGDIRLYGLLSMKIYYNIFNGTLYMSYSMPVPYTGKDLDSVENSMLKQIFSGRDYKREKPLEINGVPGGSFIQKNAGGYKKVYLLTKENIIYFAMGFSTSETETSLQAVNQFFDSYQPVHNQQDQNAKGYAYVDSVHLYKVLLPAKPNLIENLQGGDKTLKSVIMISADPQTGTYFFCGSNDCKKGYVFRNDSTIMHNVHDNIIAKYSDVTLDTAYSKNNRRILEMEGSMMNGAMRAKTITTIRGNRYYSLLIMYAPGKWNEDMNKMQSSFHLMDYPSAHWARVSTPDSLFTTWAPAGFLYSDGKNNDEALQFLHYECFDSSRVHFYLMQIDTLNNYFWRKNDSVFWESEKNKYVTDLDSVLSEKMYTKDGLLQYEYLVRAKGGNNITRMHMWLRGNLIYLMSTVQEPETIGEENVNRFFDQFHFNRAANKSHVFESKAALLLKDLQSADTLVSRKANNALPYAPFDATEIPLLQHAVLVSYPADSTLTNSTNGQIAEKIIGLNDASSVAFARKHFVMTTDEEPKNGLMDILSAWHTRSNYDSLGRLLIASPPKYTIPNWVTGKWQDSLQLAASLFPTVLPLLKDSVLAPAIFDLADGLLKDSLISIEIFHPWQHAILQFAGQRFRKTKLDTLLYTDADYSVIYILQRMKTDSCNAMLKKWLDVESNAYHKQNIVLSLLKNNQEINSSVLQELAANENTRLELYVNLKEYKRTALFPVKYQTQAYFAGSLARESAGQYSDQESDITFLHTKEMKWHGKMSRFFFYDLLLKNDNKHLLAVAGPFNINKANISFTEADGDVYSEEYYDEKNADKQMKALVVQMENK